jgi:hypothetical protein
MYRSIYQVSYILNYQFSFFIGLKMLNHAHRPNDNT